MHLILIAIKKVFLIFIFMYLLGSTLVINAEEPNSFFGGMAAPEWNSEKFIED